MENIFHALRCSRFHDFSPFTSEGGFIFLFWALPDEVTKTFFNLASLDAWKKFEAVGWPYPRIEKLRCCGKRMNLSFFMLNEKRSNRLAYIYPSYVLDGHFLFADSMYLNRIQFQVFFLCLRLKSETTYFSWEEIWDRCQSGSHSFTSVSFPMDVHV